MANTHRERMMLAALAAAGPDADLAPVQVQKLFFLVDQNIADEVRGPLFAFSPYDYGPFDSAVYSELEALRGAGEVQIEASPGPERRRYSLTAVGYNEGARLLAELTPRARAYLARVSAWVLSLSFSELVGAVYKAYPAMRANSVFRD